MARYSNENFLNGSFFILTPIAPAPLASLFP